MPKKRSAQGHGKPLEPCEPATVIKLCCYLFQVRWTVNLVSTAAHLQVRNAFSDRALSLVPRTFYRAVRSLVSLEPRTDCESLRIPGHEQSL